MDQKEILTEKDLSLVVVLPDGVEKMTMVPGRYRLVTAYANQYNWVNSEFCTSEV